MLTTWLDIFREQSLIKKILGMYQDMIESARWMYEKTGKTLIDGEDPARWEDELAERERMLDKAEQDVRKLIIEHLAINPARDLGASLVFFSGVKDAERLGDYCNNLQEVAQLQKGRSFPGPYKDVLGSVFTLVEKQFDKTALAFADWDVEAAIEVRKVLDDTMDVCSGVVAEVHENPHNLDVPDALTVMLTARYLKRIGAHLRNIAFGVSGPVKQSRPK